MLDVVNISFLTAGGRIRQADLAELNHPNERCPDGQSSWANGEACR